MNPYMDYVLRRTAEGRAGHAPPQATRFGDVLQVETVKLSGVCHALGLNYWRFVGRLECSHHGSARIVGVLVEYDEEDKAIDSQPYERWLP